MKVNSKLARASQVTQPNMAFCKEKVAMRVLVLMLLFIIAPATPAMSVDCDVQLKATDDYRDLSDKLKCLKDAIESLQSGGLKGETPVALKRPASQGAVSANAGSLLLEFEGCKTKAKSINCDFTFTNLTREDKEGCMGNAYIIFDSGYAHRRGFEVNIGNNGRGNRFREICETIPPLTRVKAWITIEPAEIEAIQYLRVACGVDCKFEAYEVAIN